MEAVFSGLMAIYTVYRNNSVKVTLIYDYISDSRKGWGSRNPLHGSNRVTKAAKPHQT